MTKIRETSATMSDESLDSDKEHDTGTFLGSFARRLKSLKRDTSRMVNHWQTAAEKRSIRKSTLKPRKVDVESQLCTVCRRIDIKALILSWQPEVEVSKGEFRYPGRRATLGALDEIVVSDCLLCKLVTEAVLDAWRISLDNLADCREKCKPLICYLGTQYVPLDCVGRDLDSERGSYVLQHPLPHGPGVLYIEIETPDNSDMLECAKYVWGFYRPLFMSNDSKPTVTTNDAGLQTYQPQLRLLADDAPLLRLETFGLGKATSLLDFSLLRSWYETCLELHDCSSSKPRTPGMRLVDTWEMNIKAAPRSKFKYAALSYVWGTAKQLTALESNYHALEVEGNLSQRQVPQTIVDAIDVVKKMGIRYLWVDALCIIQDSPTQKQAQIESMDKIYRGAELTIVAAAGNHANYGLAGAHQRDTTLAMESIQGVRLMAPPADVNCEMKRSAWFTRGWCYQEWKLSKRLLLFSPRQVYFACQAASFCESIHAQLLPGKLNPTPQGSDIEFNPVWREWSWSTYKSRLHEYTARSLTVESDVLNACLGVLNSMRINVKDSFVGGVPRNTLLRGLLWQPASSIRRRSYSNIPFPSWSWIGWVGPTNFEPWTHWTEVIVQEWFYRDTRTLQSLGKGSIRKRNRSSRKKRSKPTNSVPSRGLNDAALDTPQKEDSSVSGCESCRGSSEEEDFDDNVYGDNYGRTPALKRCDGYQFLKSRRRDAAQEVLEELNHSGVLLVPSQHNPKLLEYALVSALSDYETATARSPSQPVDVLTNETIQENGVLQFYTETAKFVITTAVNFPLPRQTEPVSVFEPFPADPALRLFRLVDPKLKNRWIGSVQLLAEFFVDRGIDTLEREFVLLSACKLARSYFHDRVYTRSTTFFRDEKSGPFLTRDSEFMIGLNVMMVEMRRGVAYRLGLGKVHYKAWEAATPVRKVVTLG